MPNEVRLYRNAAEARGRDLFACSMIQWTFLLELGRTFGWRAQGATYELPSGSKVTAARRDYEPGSAADRKVVDTEDALSWARALEEAQRSPHLPAMIEARFPADSAESAARSILDLLDEFIEYAYGGEFTFARAEEQPEQPE